jgi:ABC-2 type transport system permease protein
MLGRTLGGATVAAMQGIIVFLLSFIAGFRLLSFSLLPLVFVFMFLVALLFTAIGLSIASLLEDMQGFQLIMNFLVMPTFFLSGALFPMENLPKILEIIIRFNPLAYGVDGIRGCLGGATIFGLTSDLAILFVSVAFLISIGSYLFSKIQV